MSNRNHEVQIHSVAHGGEGVGKGDDPRTWLVRGALPGERVQVELVKEAKRWLRGRTLRVLEPSPVRVSPPCPLAEDCGGCSWQHVDPGAQGGLKREIVLDQLRRVLPRGLDVPPTVVGPARGYRRRARLHYDGSGSDFDVGFYGARSRRLVAQSTCMVLDPALNRAIQRVRHLQDHLPPRGEVVGLSDGEHVLLGFPGLRPDHALEAAFDEFVDDHVVGILARGGRQRTSIGANVLELDRDGGIAPTFANPFTFAQANGVVNRELVRWVVRQSRAGGRRVLELYAGAGNFTRALAREAKRVWAIEQDREAVKLHREMLEAHGLSINAKHASAERTLAKFAASKTTYDVVVLDPPRQGVGQAGAADLARVALERIVYVSCDPATLARDLRVLCDQGFRLTDLCAFDMMPMTPQVEVAAALARA